MDSSAYPGLASATIPITSLRSCVIYDSETGQIHHQHQVLTVEGGKEFDDDEMAADALYCLGDRLAHIATLEVLHVSPDAMAAGQHYRVDHARRALVEIDSKHTPHFTA